MRKSLLEKEISLELIKSKCIGTTTKKSIDTIRAYVPSNACAMELRIHSYLDSLQVFSSDIKSHIEASTPSVKDLHSLNIGRASV